MPARLPCARLWGAARPASRPRNSQNRNKGPGEVRLGAAGLGVGARGSRVVMSEAARGNGHDKSNPITMIKLWPSSSQPRNRPGLAGHRRPD